MARKELLQFSDFIDNRSLDVIHRQVARLIDTKTGAVQYIVIGTMYGTLRRTDGSIATWKTYSGARRALIRYNKAMAGYFMEVA